MLQKSVAAISAMLMIGGCAHSHMAMGPPQKPQPAPEMAKLSRMIGTWSGTARMIEPSPEKMRKAMPAGYDEMPSSMNGGGKIEWTMDRMALTEEGWYEMGQDQRVNYVSYWTWDPKLKKYRTWMVTDWGETGDGLAWYGADEDTMVVKSTMRDSNGGTRRGKGSFTFVDQNTMNWTWSENGAMGKMKLEGTSRRGH